MIIKDFITKNLIVGDVSDSVYTISKLMKDNDIGFVPISDNKRIVGVITDRDIVVRCVSNNDINSSIINYISKNIISVDANSSVPSVLKVMRKYKIKRVLVTSDNKVIGVISISDMLNIDGFNNLVLESIKSIFSVGANIHKYETEIDEFYL